jgi:hypothetical protein
MGSLWDPYGKRELGTMEEVGIGITSFFCSKDKRKESKNIGRLEQIG